MDKHLVLFPIPEPFARHIRKLMDRVSEFTNLPQPHLRLPPHITFHRPIAGIDEKVIHNLTRSAALQIRQTRITTGRLSSFGKQYIVLPVQVTKSSAALWICINDLLARLPEYEHGEYDGDNTLHITIAAKTSSVFDGAWPVIKRIQIEQMSIPLETIALYRKPAEGGTWRAVDTFAIPA